MTKPVLFIPSRPSDLSAEQLRIMSLVLDTDCISLVSNVIARYLNVNVSEIAPLIKFHKFKTIERIKPVDVVPTNNNNRAAQLTRCRYSEKSAYEMNLALIQARNKN